MRREWTAHRAEASREPIKSFKKWQTHFWKRSKRINQKKMRREDSTQSRTKSKEKKGRCTEGRGGIKAGKQVGDRGLSQKTEGSKDEGGCCF